MLSHDGAVGEADASPGKRESEKELCAGVEGEVKFVGDGVEDSLVVVSEWLSRQVWREAAAEIIRLGRSISARKERFGRERRVT